MVDALEDVICCPFCGTGRNCEEGTDDYFEPIFIGIVFGLRCPSCKREFSVVTPSGGQRIDERREDVECASQKIT